MRPHRSWTAALVTLVACAQIVGLDELREDERSLQTTEREEPDGGASAAPGLVASAGPAGTMDSSAGSGGAPALGAANGGAASSTDSDGSNSGGSDSGGSDGGGSDGGEASSSPEGLAGAGQVPAETGAAAGSGNAPSCGMNTDCPPSAPCTTAVCQDGQCVVGGPAAPGTPCGSDIDDECTNPDACDAQGICQNEDEVGTPCAGGTCAGGVCVSLPPSGCAVDLVSSVPFTASWSSVGRPDLYDGGCDSEGTPDYALVFTAPQSGIFRITSTGLVDNVPYTGPGAPGVPGGGPLDGDAVMTVANGDCAGAEAQQRGCNDDAAAGTLSAQLDLDLSAGEVVTIYLNELQQTGGGTGSVSISLLP